jgi:hypothetical protein
MHLNPPGDGSNPVYAQYQITARLTEKYWTSLNLGPLPFPTPLPTEPHWARSLNTALKTFSWRWKRWYHHTFWTPKMERGIAAFFTRPETREELEGLWKSLLKWKNKDVDLTIFPVRYAFETKGQYITASYWVGGSPHLHFARLSFDREQARLFSQSVREGRLEQVRKIVEASQDYLALEATAEAYIANHVDRNDRDVEFEKQFRRDCHRVIGTIEIGGWNLYHYEEWAEAVGPRSEKKLAYYTEGNMRRVLELALEPKKRVPSRAITNEVEIPRLAEGMTLPRGFVGDEALKASRTTAADKGEKKASSQKPNREDKAVTLPPENKDAKPAAVEKKESVELPAENKGEKKEQSPPTEEKQRETKGEDKEREGK